MINQNYFFATFIAFFMYYRKFDPSIPALLNNLYEIPPFAMDVLGMTVSFDLLA